jgi:hypothetical protein
MIYVPRVPLLPPCRLQALMFKFLTPGTRQMRQRYKKIYEDFRPQFMAWKLVLLCRKLLFAIVVVMPSNIEMQVWLVLGCLGNTISRKRHCVAPCHVRYGHAVPVLCGVHAGELVRSTIHVGLHLAAKV